MQLAAMARPSSVPVTRYSLLMMVRLGLGADTYGPPRPIMYCSVLVDKRGGDDVRQWPHTVRG